ncbi:MAG: metallophosphoesterase [Clostridia bacterium]|nr:metallophosphoesterase [Clostridia bacterium]
MIRILHCADLHLDAPFSMKSPREAERRRTELRSDLSTLTLAIRQQEIKLCLISGDLFDRNEVTPETRECLERELRGCPDCRFVLVAGNHDPLTAGSPYRYFDFPSNVTVFPAERTVLHLEDPDGPGVDVYGYSFDGKNNGENPVT